MAFATTTPRIAVRLTQTSVTYILCVLLAYNHDVEEIGSKTTTIINSFWWLHWFW